MSGDATTLAPDQGAMPVGSRRALRPLLHLLLGVVAGLLAFDLGLGWFDAARDLSGEPMHVADPELGWTNLPGFRNAKTTISSLGLRSPEIPADAPRDELRILGVGPSTTFGAGRGGPDMAHTWSVSLETECARRLPGHWRVLNGGVMGYSAVQAARRAMRLLPQVQPDLLLVFIGPGSQMLLDPSAARHYVHVGDALLPVDIAEAWPAPLLPLAADLHGLLKHSAIYARYRARATDKGGRAPGIDKFVLSRGPPPPGTEVMLQRTWDELAVLARVAREAGVAVRMVLVPEPYMDSEASWRAYLSANAAFGAPPPGTSREEPLDALREACERFGLSCWSLADVLEQIGSDHARYTCDDAHWSAEGHALVAEGLARRLAADTTPRDASGVSGVSDGTGGTGGTGVSGAAGANGAPPASASSLLDSLRAARAARPRD